MILPEYFETDVQNKDTNLIPFILIGDLVLNPNNGVDINTWKELYFISTTEINIGLAGFDENGVDAVGSRIAMPILLNIPTIKESIDIEKRKYKISNVTLNISNYEYNGHRFSDIVGTRSLINTECRIYWASQSTTGHHIDDINYDPSAGDALQIFYGKIHKYTHDDEKAQIVVEDQSQSYLNTQVPVANLGGNPNVPEKYKGKPIPMVYGYVDRSPCVFKTEEYDSESPTEYLSTIIIDNVGINSVISNPDEQHSDHGLYTGLVNINMTEGCLYASDGNGYAHCARIFRNDTTTFLRNIIDIVETSEDKDDERPAFLTIPAQHNEINRNYLENPSSGSITLTPNENDVSRGIFRGLLRRKTKGATYHHGDENNIAYYSIFNNNLSSGTDYKRYVAADTSDFHEAGSGLENIISTGSGSWGCALRGDKTASNSDEYIYFGISLEPVSTAYDSHIYFAGTFYRESGGDLTIQLGDSENPPNNYPHVYIFIDKTEREPSSNAVWTGKWWGFETAGEDGWFDNTTLTSSDHIFNRRLIDIGPPSNINQFYIGVEKWKFDNEEVLLYPVAIDVYNANIFHVTYVTDLLKQDYYAAVRGRNSLYDIETSVVYNMADKIQSIIADILYRELKQPYKFAMSTYTEYDQWKYAFSLNTNMTAKKLIEQIASGSPYIARHDNMGNFKFDVIKKYYTKDMMPDHIIYKDDHISHVYSRTPIEAVFSKVELHYHYDYANKQFSKTHTATNLPSGYTREFYGMTGSEIESTLVVNDERGKYIRTPDPLSTDFTTHIFFAEWLLLWHCNQHLKLKVKLGLKYLGIEVGNIVRFDEVLGNVNPYGIDYSMNATVELETDNDYYGAIVNGQQVFPDFMCISTNKTLEYVEAEFIQMHNLSPNIIYIPIYGCTDSAAWNYNEDAVIDDGSCLLPPRLDNDNNLLEANTAFNNAFLQSDVCPNLINPDTGEDYAQNYPEDHIPYGESLIDPQNNHYDYDDLGSIDEAYSYYLEEFNKYNGTSINMPALYSLSQCVWADVWESVLKKINFISFEYDYGLSNYLSFGNPNEGLATWPHSYQGSTTYVPIYILQTITSGADFAYYSFPSDSGEFNDFINSTYFINNNVQNYVLKCKFELGSFNPNTQEPTYLPTEIKLEIEPTGYKYNYVNQVLESLSLSTDPIVITNPEIGVVYEDSFNIEGMKLFHTDSADDDLIGTLLNGSYDDYMWTFNVKATIINEYYTESIVSMRIRLGKDSQPADIDSAGWIPIATGNGQGP